MKRRDFLTGMGAMLAGGGLYRLSSAESKPGQKPEDSSLEPETNDELPLQTIQPETVSFEQDVTSQMEKKEEAVEHVDVLSKEFDEIVESMSPETIVVLKRFYRNKHSKKECTDVKALLKSEWKRISQQERKHLVEARFGNHEELVSRYLKPFVENKQKILSVAETASEKTGVPLWVILGVIGVESGGDPSAKNDQSGAAGLMQIMENTARNGLGLKIENKIDERLDPEQCINAGARYLALLYKQFGQWSLALTAYAGGNGKLRGRIKSAYQNAGLPVPQPPNPQTLRDHGVNLVTLYSKEFARLGIHHSVQYPLFVESMAKMVQTELNRPQDLSQQNAKQPV